MTESPWLPPWLLLVKVGLTKHMRLLIIFFTGIWLLAGEGKEAYCFASAIYTDIFRTKNQFHLHLIPLWCFFYFRLVYIFFRSFVFSGGFLYTNTVCISITMAWLRIIHFRWSHSWISKADKWFSWQLKCRSRQLWDSNISPLPDQTSIYHITPYIRNWVTYVISNCHNISSAIIQYCILQIWNSVLKKANCSWVDACLCCMKLLGSFKIRIWLDEGQFNKS